MEGIIGYVTLFAGNFAPMNWAYCQGQILNIQSNTALFAIIGTYYGGNGQTTFALPDLRGRAVIGAGQNFTLGEFAGTQTVTLNSTQMPAHSHGVSVAATYQCDSSGGTTVTSPVNNVYGMDVNVGSYGYASTANATMKPYNGSITMQSTGTSVPFNIETPYMGLNYIICQMGIFPSRN